MNEFLTHHPSGAWALGEEAGPCSRLSCLHGPSGIRLKAAWGKAWGHHIWKRCPGIP